MSPAEYVGATGGGLVDLITTALLCWGLYALAVRLGKVLS